MIMIFSRNDLAPSSKDKPLHEIETSDFGIGNAPAHYAAQIIFIDGDLTKHLKHRTERSGALQGTARALSTIWSESSVK